MLPIKFYESLEVPYMKNLYNGLDSKKIKIGKGIIDLKVGDRFQGVSYVDMINKSINTNLKGQYRKSSVRLGHIGQETSMIAWFAKFDGIYRRSGADGCYTNVFCNDFKIVERCHVDDLEEYKNKRLACPPIRLVFQRDPEHDGNSNLCEFKGVFHCDMINIYKVNSSFLGESTLVRCLDIEEFLHS